MIIYFNNGERKIIDGITGKNIINAIKEKILETGGAKQWQVFSNKNNECILIINLSEVSYIEDNENIF